MLDLRTGSSRQGSFREESHDGFEHNAEAQTESRMKLSVLNQPVQDQKETKESHWATEPIPSQNTSTSSIQDEDALLSMQEAADPSDVVNIRDGDTLPKSLRVALSQELLDQISSRMHDADHGQLDSVDMLELLLAFDQLRAQKSAGNILKGWQEGQITFPPSYKFDPYTKRHDTSKKSRVPSWTDRVLFSHQTAESSEDSAPPLELLGYASVEQAFHSDHRPVIARFRLEL